MQNIITLREVKLFFVVLFCIGVLMLMIAAFAPGLVKGDDTHTLSANIGTSVSCSTEPGATGFGTLTTSSIHTATSTATSTLSCNASAGCTLYVKDAGDTSDPGLYNSNDTDLIDSATETLSAGSEGYGIQATTTDATGSGAELAIDAVYDKTDDDVGGFQITNQTLGSSDSPLSGREAVVTYKATISSLNKAGSYNDTITYECTGN